jgi:hypothetical protein
MTSLCLKRFQGIKPNRLFDTLEEGVRPLKYRLKGPILIRMLLLGVACSSGATAAIINPPLTQFKLTNTSADGSVSIANDGLSFVLTGGNTGSGLPGTTEFTVLAQNPGTVEFVYSYSSLDPSPGFDIAGYLLGSTRVPLAGTDGESGFWNFSVGAAQTYGWYIDTLDNTGEPGILTVTFAPSVSAAPEPAGVALTLTGIAAFAATRRLSSSEGRRYGEKNS